MYKALFAGDPIYSLEQVADRLGLQRTVRGDERSGV